jgi:tRNA (adenine22-N1)-methyltransferase
MKLSRRLKRIETFIPPGSRVADIGSDHGYLAMDLMVNRLAAHVVATDKNPGPVKKLKRNIARRKLTGAVEVLQTDGMRHLDPSVDVVIIAGMGGLLIRDILFESLSAALEVGKLILQPMSQSDKLRRFLLDHGFMICEEAVVFEDERFYEILVAARGSQRFEDPLDFEISPVLIRNLDEDGRLFLTHRLALLGRIAKDIEVNSKDPVKLRQLRRRMGKYEEVLSREDQYREGHQST